MSESNTNQAQTQSDISKDEHDRYANKSTDQDTGRYAEQTTDSVQNSETSDMPELAADLSAMVENINADLSSLYQEINQHINEQLDQVKESRQDIQALMKNLGQQLKNTQKK